MRNRRLYSFSTCLGAPTAVCVVLLCGWDVGALPDHIAPAKSPGRGRTGRGIPSVRLIVSIWSFTGFQYGLANDEGILGVIFIVFETTERIPFRFKVFLLIPLTNRVSSHIIG